MQRKGITPILGLAFFVVIVFALWALMPSFQELGLIGDGQRDTGGIISDNIICPDDLATDGKSRLYCLSCSNASYIDEQVVVTDAEGNKIGSGSTGSSASYATIYSGLTCGKTYGYYVLGSNKTIPVSVTDILAESNEVQIQIDGKYASGLNCTVYYTNMTNAVDNTSYIYGMDTSAPVLPPLVTSKYSSGTSRTFIVHCEANTSSAQFGSDELPSYALIDIPLSSVGKDGVVVSGSKVKGTAAMPAWGNAEGYDKAYEIDSIASDDGLVVFNVKIHAQLGDPSNVNVTVRFVSEGYYEGTNGQIEHGVGDDSLSALGLDSTRIVWNLT